MYFLHLGSKIQGIPSDEKYEQYQHMLTMTSDDDNEFHEHQMISRKRVIKRKIEEYANTFTMHGLSRFITGKNVECMFWFMMLFGGLVTSSVVIHGLITKYYRFEIYTEIRSVIANENYFPAITICEQQLFVDNYFSYCGVAGRFKHDNDSNYCKRNFYLDTKGNITYKKGEFWSNGMFEVTRCRTWGGLNCIDTGFIRTMYHFNHSCFTWNYAGNLSDVYSHAELWIDFNPPHWLGKMEKVIALPHDPKDHEIDITKKVEIEAYKKYEIKLDKILIKRLPAPFPSKCTFEKSEDIFPGRYTRRSCIESHNYLEVFKACGDIFDYVFLFIPDDLKRKYSQNRTIGEAKNCIWSMSEKGTQRTSECEFPCDDYGLSVIHSFNERKDPRIKAKYQINIQYQKVDTYQTMEEKELYSWDQMLSEMGGLIGLIIGASVLSVVEIFVYLFLVMVNKICC